MFRRGSRYGIGTGSVTSTGSACDDATHTPGAASELNAVVRLMTDAREQLLAEHDIVRQPFQLQGVRLNAMAPEDGSKRGPVACLHVLLRVPIVWLVRADNHACRVRDLLDRSGRSDVGRARGAPASVSQEQDPAAFHEDGLVVRRYRQLPRVSDRVIDLDVRHQASHVDHLPIMPLASMCWSSADPSSTGSGYANPERHCSLVSTVILGIPGVQAFRRRVPPRYLSRQLANQGMSDQVTEPGADAECQDSERPPDGRGYRRPSEGQIRQASHYPSQTSRRIDHATVGIRSEG